MSDEADNKIHEQLSSWMDNELLGDEARFLQRRLDNNQALRIKWERYHLIGDAIRDSLPAQTSLSLADRVQVALAHEAAAQAPTRRRRPVLGFGMAASLAVMAGAVLWTRSQTADMDVQGPANTAMTMTAAAPAAQAMQVETDNQLEAMLANHSELLARSGGAGMVPYVRMADYNGSKDVANK
jgi:sigma-E factor negative regulatory protein RseA